MKVKSKTTPVSHSQWLLQGEPVPQSEGGKFSSIYKQEKKVCQNVWNE